MILAIHHPSETANAPTNKPMTVALTPSHMAPPAAIAAPAVHNGQCANVRGIRKNDIKGRSNSFFIFSHPHEDLGASIFFKRIDDKLSLLASGHPGASRWHPGHGNAFDIWSFFQ